MARPTAPRTPCACSASRSTAASRPCATSAAATTRLSRAIADGLIRAPRFFYAGKVLSMTGGHGDMRPIDETPQYHAMCSCGGIVNSCAKVADGVDAVHPGRARGAAPRRALHQDHGLRRRGLAHRSDLDEPVPRG